MSLGLRDTLELVIRADPTGAISALERTADTATKAGSSVESSLGRIGTSMMKVGAAGLGAGALLMTMASGDIEAANQLKAAIGQAGQSYDDYKDRIEATVSAQAKFGHTDEEVKNSLTTLTLSYNDTGKALDAMQLTADLAARKHIGLADAANIVAKAHGGAGRVFKEFGITVQEGAGHVKDYDGALTELAGKLHGQASAAADTWGGKLAMIRAEITNQVSEFGQSYGPALMGVSAAFTLLGGAASGVSTIIEKVRTAHQLAADAAAAQAAADIGLAGSEDIAAGASRGLLVSLGGLGLAVGVAAGFVAMIAATMGDDTHAAEALDHALSGLGDTFSTFGQGNHDLRGDMQQFLDGLVGAAEGGQAYADTFNAVGLTTQDFAKVLGQGTEASSRFVIGLNYSGAATDAQAHQLGELIQKTSDHAHSVLEVDVAQGKLTQDQLDGAEATHQLAAGGVDWLATLQSLGPQIDQGTNAVEGNTKAIEEGAKALAGFGDLINNLGTAMDKTYQASVAGTKAHSAYEAGMDNLTDSVKKNGKTLDDSTAKGRANIAAALDAGSAIAKLIEAKFEETHSVDAATAAGSMYVAGLTQQLQAAGLNTQQISDMISTMGLTPDQIKTSFSTNALEQQIVVGKYLAQLDQVPPDKRTMMETEIEAGQFDLVNAQLDDLAHGRSVFYYAVAGNADAPPQTKFGGVRAGGGPVSFGSSYIVGEAGPELFTPTTAGHITPAADTKAMSVGGGVTFAPVITVNAMDARGVDLAVLEALHSAVRTYEVPDAIKQAFTN